MTNRVALSAWVLIPVRRLDVAKSRLSPVLSPEERASLQRGMLADVLAAASQARRISRVAIVSADPQVAAIGRLHGAYIIGETTRPGLNAAIANGTEALAARGAQIIVALPADVPLADSAEIDKAVELADSDKLTVVVPDRRTEGTNALVFHTAAPPAFDFGPGSFQRHLTGTAGRPARQLTLSSLALDIDTPGDLAAFIKVAGPDRAPHTRAALSCLPCLDLEEFPR